MYRRENHDDSEHASERQHDEPLDFREQRFQHAFLLSSLADDDGSVLARSDSELVGDQIHRLCQPREM
jgi:hypothetical protein